MSKPPSKKSSAAEAPAELPPMDLNRLAPAEGSTMAIVGACGGIGQAVVRAALGCGLRVAALDLPRSIEENPLPAGVDRVLPLDATREEEVAAAFGQLREHWPQGLRSLVNLAGFTAGSVSLEELPVETWNEVLDGSLRSTFLACRAAMPQLRRSGGAVVNMSSGLASVGRSGYGPYAAAKAGVGGLTRILAAEGAPSVRVNAVAPGAIDTAFLSGGTGRGGQQGASPLRLDLDAYLQLVPLRRIGQPDEVAGPILFLASDAARYVTGQVLHINGGGLMMG